jgi:hypothetical protein
MQKGEVAEDEKMLSPKPAKRKKILLEVPTTSREPESGTLKAFIVGTSFDIIMAIVIVINVLLTITQIQWQGYEAGYRIDMLDESVGYSNMETAFETSDRIFNGIYIIEMLMRLWALQWNFFYHGSNILDAAIVIITSVESFILSPMQSEGSLVNLSSLRIMRAFRILRVQKIMQFTEHMDEMRVLIDTLILSMRGLGWSIVLIVGIIMAAASLMAQISLPALDDQSISLERRQWLWRHFGTSGRSCYTMFEITFTGGWRIPVRTVLEELNAAFGLFLIPYIVCVNFAVMRVVSALFLKQTLAVAAKDEEKKLEAQRVAEEKAAKEISEFFQEADASGNGCVSLDEFDTMMKNPNVQEHFEDLGLTADEAESLFGVLCADDGEADFKEFLAAALKMRRNAQVIDLWMVLHRQIQSQQKLHDMHEVMQGVHTKLHGHAHGALPEKPAN